MDLTPVWLPYLLQTADASFPTGAYAHSLGFEECVRLGLAHDETSLRDFLLRQIIPAQREHELPYLRFCVSAAAARDLPELCTLDHEISSWKLAQESRIASGQLGARRLTALRTISDSPLLAHFDREITAKRVLGHHLVVCGLQAAVEKVPLGVALATSFYQALASICAASLKLFRIGQDGCQRALRHAALLAAETVASSMRVGRADAGWFNPLLEIAGMRHEHADERLFIS